MPFTQNTHPPHIFNEQVPISRMQRSGVPSIPAYTQNTPLYTSNFFSNQGSASVPRLRPASWDSPSQVDEEIENYYLPRTRSSVDLLGDSSGEEEGLLLGRRTLPPLIIPHGSWNLDVHTASNASQISSCERTPDSVDISATISIPTVPFLTNFSNEKYRWGNNLSCLCRR